MRRAMRGVRPVLIPVAVLLLALAPQMVALARGDSSGAAHTASTSPTRHITIIGASVSDGFGVRLRTTQPDGTRSVIGVNLATLLDAAVIEPQAVKVTTHATSRFFLSPDAVAKASIEQAVADRPSLVLAIDWLFWNSYGGSRADGKPIRKCDDRAERLERALILLQPLVDTGVLVVLGDLPDMHDPIEGGMLTESMVPDEACLKRLNERIHAWAATRPNVALLDLADVVRRTLSGQPIRACNRDWCQADLGPLLQKDQLHPTLNGSLAVLASALQAADGKTEGKVSKAFDLDPAKVRARLTLMAAQRKAADATGSSAAPPAPPAAGGSSSPSAP